MRRLAAAALLALALSSCSVASSPEAELQEKANDVVEAANAGDASALRTAAGRMLEEVQQQSADADITSTKAQALRSALTRILNKADLLDETEPSPSPTSEKPSPSPSPSPEPSPSPSPSEAPPSPDVVPSVEVSGAALEQSPEASASPAA